MKVWEEFLQKEAQQLGSEAIEKWAKTLKVVDFDAANLYLEAGDSFQAHWFEEHLRPRLCSLRNNNGRPIKVHLATPQSLSKKKWKPILNLIGDPLDPKSRFDTFFPAKTDQTSLELLQESLEKGLYNPIYLHGESGSGKNSSAHGYCQSLADQGVESHLYQSRYIYRTCRQCDPQLADARI